VVDRPVDSLESRAVRAAIEDAVGGFDAVSDDLAAAMSTGRSEAVDRALERIEYVRDARRHDLERPVIIVPADFALWHCNPLG